MSWKRSRHCSSNLTKAGAPVQPATPRSRGSLAVYISQIPRMRNRSSFVTGLQILIQGSFHYRIVECTLSIQSYVFLSHTFFHSILNKYTRSVGMHAHWSSQCLTSRVTLKDCNGVSLALKCNCSAKACDAASHHYNVQFQQS